MWAGGTWSRNLETVGSISNKKKLEKVSGKVEVAGGIIGHGFQRSGAVEHGQGENVHYIVGIRDYEEIGHKKVNCGGLA